MTPEEVDVFFTKVRTPFQQILEKGEHEGHPFRGNQWTGGIAGKGAAKKDRVRMRDQLVHSRWKRRTPMYDDDVREYLKGVELPTDRQIKRTEVDSTRRLKEAFPNAQIKFPNVHPVALRAITKELVAFAKEYPIAAQWLTRIGVENLPLATVAQTALMWNHRTYQPEMALYFNPDRFSPATFDYSAPGWEQAHLDNTHMTDGAAGVTRHELGHVLSFNAFIHKAHPDVLEEILTTGNNAHQYFDLHWTDAARNFDKDAEHPHGVTTLEAAVRHATTWSVEGAANNPLGEYAKTDNAEAIAEAYVVRQQQRGKLTTVRRPPKLAKILEDLLDEIEKDGR